jgi:hypothetical protein
MKIIIAIRENRGNFFKQGEALLLPQKREAQKNSMADQ